MPTHTELRVHGVSGAPPRDILYTDPVTSDPGDDYTRVYRRRSPDRSSGPDGTVYEFEAKAFHWGGLTSGHWATAFWMLLSPFAFANVSGWMTRRNTRLSHLTLRLAGLGLTSLFVAQIGYMFLEIPSALGWDRGWLVLAATVYLLTFVGVIVLWLSTQSHFGKALSWPDRIRLTFHPSPEYMRPPGWWEAANSDEWKDPAGSQLNERSTWLPNEVVHRIRRIHLACGLLVMSTIISVGMRAWFIRDLSLLGFVILVILLSWSTFGTASGVIKHLTAWAPLAALVVAELAVSQMIIGTLPDDGWADINTVTFVIAIALGFFAVTTVVAGLSSLGAIAFGALFGGSLGIGGALLLERWAELDRITEAGAGWVAVAMLLMIMTLLVVGFVLSFMPIDETLPEEGRLMAAIRRITRRAHWLFISAALYSLAAGAFAVLGGCVFGSGASCDPADLGAPEPGGPIYLIAVILAAELVVLLAVRLMTIWPSTKTFVITTAAGIGALWLILLFWNERLGVSSGLAVDFNSLVDVSTVLIILIPTGFIVKSLGESLVIRSTNRHVGILWDLASFWPRWFHPLAPPAYGPKIVEDLSDEIANRKPDLLEAHSQGSVIAAATLSQMDEIPEGVGLITYGSPLGILYKRVFPATGVDTLVAEVAARLGGRWRNLWRDTDPLGGEPVGLGDSDMLTTTGTGHGGYERTPSFKEARNDLI